MAVTKSILTEWLLDALNANGGRARIAKICKYIWDNHETELRDAGDLFYTWQYDVRWAADKLRRNGKMKPAYASPQVVWELNR
jgi:hypothetical protein